ncbi:MAG TPA: type II toxin-antitoxin system RelE/ParE family toxin [Roseiarcus sp.]|nr:type II toxin-antitoxin system RelE/ParE family toxin [Roseiarcus sp.]
MIESIRHKGLRRLYRDGDPSGVNQEHVKRLRYILAVLDAASTINGVNMPTFDLHPLKGKRKGEWAITVRANWRVTFRFEEGKGPSDVDYEDYH